MTTCVWEDIMTKNTHEYEYRKLTGTKPRLTWDGSISFHKW